MHALSPVRMTAFVGTDDAPLAEWRADAANLYRGVAAAIPSTDRPAIETFLAAEPPPPVERLVFSHNDLGIEHILVEPRTGAVTGIIDWSDAAMVDPAYDVGLLYRDLGLVVRAIVGLASTSRLDLVARRILPLTQALLAQS
jgi:aminoglycoside phosphotransferase (APT) family kinase protein